MKMSRIAPGLVLLVTCSTTQVNSLRLRAVKRQHAKCQRPTISQHPYILSQHDLWLVEEWFFALGAIDPGTISRRPTVDVLGNSIDVTVPSKACGSTDFRNVSWESPLLEITQCNRNGYEGVG